MNFWKQMREKGPILIQAPMVGVSTPAFREILGRHSKNVDNLVLYTEFVSASGLCINFHSQRIVKRYFQYTEEERPIVAQIFGSVPSEFEKASKIIKDLGFDGIEINMGCPVQKVAQKSGAGAGLIDEPELAKEIVFATKEGSGGLPVSVKTRLGIKTNVFETWIPKLLEASPATLTVHLRTAKELSLYPAHWELMPQIKEMVKDSGKDVLLFGNGDVKSVEHGIELTNKYQIDGVMIGRAILGRPDFFSDQKLNQEEKIRVLIELINLHCDYCGDRNFPLVKRHLKHFLTQWDCPEDAKKLKIAIYESKTRNEALEVIRQYQENKLKIL